MFVASSLRVGELMEAIYQVWRHVGFCDQRGGLIAPIRIESASMIRYL